jgi:hypothetical protein
MKKTARLTLVLVMMLTLTGSVIACKSSTTSSTTTPAENPVQSYADPAAETLLKGLSENNLAKYVQNGNAQFKAAVTQEILNQVSAQIGGQLGTYVSKEFLRTEEQQGYIIVHYKAKYTKGDVGVRMVFDNEHLVAGQFFE